MELTTPSDLQPLTHPLTASLEKVTAGHLKVHMNNSGLLSAFLHLRLINKSACAITALHISLYLWTLSTSVSAHVFGHFTLDILAEHKHAQSTTKHTILFCTNSISIWMVCCSDLVVVYLFSSACYVHICRGIVLGNMLVCFLV